MLRYHQKLPSTDISFNQFPKNAFSFMKSKCSETLLYCTNLTTNTRFRMTLKIKHYHVLEWRLEKVRGDQRLSNIAL